MQKVRGYIFSSDFCGQKIPQNVQNLYIREYCKKNNLTYLLSSVEYSINESTYILDGLFEEIKELHGVVFYSIYQLPMQSKKREIFFKKMSQKKKKIYFALENIIFNNYADCEEIEILWRLKKIIISKKAFWYNVRSQ